MPADPRRTDLDSFDDSIPVSLQQQRGCMGSSCTNTSKYTKVGSGKGDFGIHTEYAYVGEGQGEYEKQEATPPAAFPYRTACVGLAALAALFLLIGLVSAITAPLFAVAPAATTTPHPGYDCKKNLERWATAWTVHQKDWCCRHRGQACPTTQRPNQMDCEIGRVRWMSGWSEPKKDWCCGYDRSGCHNMTFDCDIGFEDFEHEWTEVQKEWCCFNKGRSCKPPPLRGLTTTSIAPRENPNHYVCENDPKWRGWSQDKQIWCCSQTGFGCPTIVDKASTCATYCEYKGWAADCATRVNWAADNQAKDTASACRVAHHNVLHECPVCSECLLADTGCKDTAPGDYDCELGKEDPSQYWSVAKQAWCCLNQNKGCDASQKPAFDCGEDAETWRTAWTTSRKAWCCETLGKGCEGAVADPFDCDAGWAWGVPSWSVAKKDWCCQQMARGCPAPAQT